MSISNSFQVKTNLKELYKIEKKKGIITKKNYERLATPEERTNLFIGEAMNLKEKFLGTDITGIEMDIPKFLFKGKTLKEGLAPYLKVFEEIEKLFPRGKHPKEIDNLSYWLKSLQESRRLDLAADLNLHHDAANTPKTFNYLLNKYECIECWWF